eukprot:1136385-Pelagomonas_calceolata.AAC.1
MLLAFDKGEPVWRNLPVTVSTCMNGLEHACMDYCVVAIPLPPVPQLPLGTHLMHWHNFSSHAIIGLHVLRQVAEEHAAQPYMAAQTRKTDFICTLDLADRVHTQLWLSIVYGLLHRYIFHLGKGNHKTKESDLLRTPAHILRALTRYALLTQEKLASPLDYDTHFTAYWSPYARDRVFGANTDMFGTKFTGFSFCHPAHDDKFIYNLVMHALSSVAKHRNPNCGLLAPPQSDGMDQERLHAL